MTQTPPTNTNENRFTHLRVWFLDPFHPTTAELAIQIRVVAGLLLLFTVAAVIALFVTPNIPVTADALTLRGGAALVLLSLYLLTRAQKNAQTLDRIKPLLIAFLYLLLWVAIFRVDRVTAVMTIIWSFVVVQMLVAILSNVRWMILLGFCNNLALFTLLWIPDFLIVQEQQQELFATAVWIGLQITVMLMILIWQRTQNQVEQQKTLQNSLKQMEVANQVLLSANAMAQESVRVKTQFLATMSHELRTPLNAVMGYTSLMMQDYAEFPQNYHSSDHLKMLGSVRSNSERLLYLINDILNMAKIEAGQLQLMPEMLPTQRLLQDIRDACALFATEKQLEFTLTVDPSVPPDLYADRERLMQIFVNLVNNAIKFTESGFVRVTLSVDAILLKVEVADSGIGIPKEAHELVFEEFRQVDRGARRKYSGTGLGLAIVKRLTELMRGSIKLESDEGQGTTISVWLDVLPPATSAETIRKPRKLVVPR
jgi:signal transduction histidine kinase